MPSLRDLPGIDLLLNHTTLHELVTQFGRAAVKAELQQLQDAVRAAGKVPDWSIQPALYAERAGTRLRERHGTLGYRPVFNLTGTIIHTNLGRSLLSTEQWRRVEPLVTRPVNLEFELSTGRRGSRDATVTERLARLTGAEAALVVNNNAAAVMLALNTLAPGQPVAVSRGELVEIGGSFRLPAIMTQSGCSLCEVGTTNRTHAADFEAVAPACALLLKVHPSNYFMGGFTREVTVAELTEIARRHERPLVVDLGSGALTDLTQFGLPAETMPRDVIRQGADLVTFSGDKLLGGPQAGIIVGKRALIDRLNKNPMKRALRLDKVVLALLEDTLKQYDAPDRIRQSIPLFTLLTQPLELLEARANAISEVLREQLPDCDIAIESSSVEIGSGALPDRQLPSIAVVIRPAEGSSLEALSARLRDLPVPVITRIQNGRCILDMRMADPLPELLEVLGALHAQRGGSTP